MRDWRADGVCGKGTEPFEGVPAVLEGVSGNAMELRPVLLDGV